MTAAVNPNTPISSGSRASSPSSVSPSAPSTGKKFRWKGGYSIAIGFGLIGTFAIVYFKRQYALLNGTSFKAVGFVPSQLTIDSADFNIKFQMTNKSAIDYYITSQSYNLYIDNSFAAAITNPNSIYVAPNKTTDVWLNVTFNPSGVKNLSWQQIKDLLLNSSTVPIQLKGTASIKTLNGLVTYNYPVNETFTVKDLNS